MQTIVVPTDFSTVSINAAYYACDMALLVKADIILMHAIIPPVTFSEVPLSYDAYERTVADVKEQAALLKGWLVKYVNEKVRISVSVTAGSFLSSIKDLVEDTDTFAVVMASQGAGAVEAFLLGSYTQAAAQELDCPLIIVPPDARYQGVKKVALACDMKDVSDTMPLKGVRSLFTHLNASLEVCYISKPDKHAFAEVLEGSTVILNELSKYHPQIRIQTHTDVEGGINEFVQANKIDLLLLILKEHHFPEAIFHRSVHKRMMLHTQVPLMLLHK